ADRRVAFSGAPDSHPRRRRCASSSSAARASWVERALGFAERLVLARRPLFVHALSPAVLLSGERTVGGAPEGEVRDLVLAAGREGLDVVKLQAMRFSATPARRVDVGAAPPVALEDGASNG